MRFMVVRLLCAVLAACIVAGCAGQRPMSREAIDARQAIEARQSQKALNEKLAAIAGKTRTDARDLQRDYTIGPGDMLEIRVFDVPEFSTMARVSGKGEIVLPLLDELYVAGMSPRQVEQVLETRLTEYIYQPDASVHVSDYRSQQVSVTGAVNNPAMHTLTRPRTVFELISMSGGLAPQAGRQVAVQTVADDMQQRLVIDLDEVLSSSSSDSFAMLLSGGDSIFVPEAGVVFVEGAVDTPGAYPLKGGSGVLEAVAMAKGTTFDARESDVQVVTTGSNGEKVVVTVSLDEIRAQASPNLPLQDGDIVMVPSNVFKRSFAGFWRGFRGIFGMGYRLNGP